MPQDMPPVGGYQAVQYKRNLPSRGFRPGTMLLGMGLVMGYGWYHLIKGIREANELAREKMWARIHLIPLLQAEEDRDQVRRYYADQAREKELLGENTKVYHNDRFVHPSAKTFRGLREYEEMLMSVCYRFVRPTFAVVPQNKS
ncbi:NADH dehydrogenase [ubiquinone] 1 alpha subcomplex subunit 13 [Colletotrichum siamense]|uniref:NADH dehydrogenase [ubiquinone] 1 alpha subcomplex subunit 13 n=1 Tax=Colletotrichum siamense TaxID=690259 RepID=A0A9P5EWV3_COLSI|nr:NADH dehydrogenase [ubiquinone] 1 alpha subcomplex subunit 13 [Colletotrichum siamense]KAF4861146.1 NADH dehydrogenase [ubiquinone] 1 alpha subcomplex subunit 13 [Colletotrichum siamense]